MPVCVNIHETTHLEARHYKGTSWVEIISEQGNFASLHVPSFEVARRTADAFNAAMEAERKPVAAE